MGSTAMGSGQIKAIPATCVVQQMLHTHLLGGRNQNINILFSSFLHVCGRNFAEPGSWQAWNIANSGATRGNAADGNLADVAGQVGQLVEL